MQIKVDLQTKERGEEKKEMVTTLETKSSPFVLVLPHHDWTNVGHEAPQIHMQVDIITAHEYKLNKTCSIQFET